MHLSSLQIVNFRNFHSASFSFTKGVNTIIGENDSGKSNAITALRILLDDSFYYNTKRLRESDFSYKLDDWRGHWIIISATLDDISEKDNTSEIISSMILDPNENVKFARNLLSEQNRNQGTVTLFIRPQKSIRRRLFETSGDQDAFEEVRESIRLSDYEFHFTTKSGSDFCNAELYNTLVGRLNNFDAADPDEEDTGTIGVKTSITDVHNYISLVFIDALRDVLKDMKLPRNPVRKIIEAIEQKIEPSSLENLGNIIMELNSEITQIEQVDEIGQALNKTLLGILGLVYSPEIALESELSGEITRLSRFIAIKPQNGDNLDLLGLGHLNMIYLALKMLEFEVCRSREVLNIMTVEEPEAHIHPHILRTLFKNLAVADNYTQILMTTHSVHLAESSEISRMNVLKTYQNQSIAMQPAADLDKHGSEHLDTKLSLTESIERYLDAKRNVLLFSKGVILVEGDAEEILLPHLVSNAFGVTLDELGIGLVNVGSTAFEYIASLFSDERIQRFCAIITDLDKQAVESTSRFFKSTAEERGSSRKSKLENLHKDNTWVNMFYAEHTFEVEFIKLNNNISYFVDIIEKAYKDNTIREEKKEAIKAADQQAQVLFTLLDRAGKGWGATMLAGELDEKVQIPPYIIEALAFATQETINLNLYKKVLLHSLSKYDSTDGETHLHALRQSRGDVELKKCIMEIMNHFGHDMAVKLIKECEELSPILVSECYAK